MTVANVRIFVDFDSVSVGTSMNIPTKDIHLLGKIGLRRTYDSDTRRLSIAESACTSSSILHSPPQRRLIARWSSRGKEASGGDLPACQHG